MLLFVDEEGLYEDAIFQDKRKPPAADASVITPGPIIQDAGVITPGPIESGPVIPLAT